MTLPKFQPVPPQSQAQSGSPKMVLTPASASPQAGSLHAEVYLAANFTLLNNTTSIIPFDTIEADPSNSITLGANFQYKCPINGRYLVISAVDFNVLASVAIEQDVFKNGALYKRVFGEVTGASASFTEGSVATIVRANALDTIDIRGLQTQGSSATIVGGSTATWAQFVYLGPL